MEDVIKIKGAREHNLKNIDVIIPKNKLVVFTGLSGSGKSSLAFDTIYAEGQRRYVESLSAYARQFLGVMDKPDVDSIEGLSPAISIDQKSTSHNPRSTVGTITEIYDYLRLLFARVGHPHCSNCGREISHLTKEQIVNQVISNSKLQTQRVIRLLILSPLVKDRKGEYTELFKNLKQKGYSRVRIDGIVYSLDEEFVLIKTNKHTIEAVVDRISSEKNKLETLRGRFLESIEGALKLSDGEVIISFVLDASFEFPQKPKKYNDQLFSEKFACTFCNISLPEIEPRTFSFNSPHGACPGCTGLGNVLTIDPKLVINPNLSISEGGILPFSRLLSSDTWYARIVGAVANRYRFSVHLPLKNLSEEQKRILLYGTGDEVFEVTGRNRFGRQATIYEEFEGIISNLERRYKETDSDYIRLGIERFMRSKSCPVCMGTRLKKEALAVTIGGQSIIDISQKSIDEGLKWISSIYDSVLVSEREKAIAKPIIKELITRLSFLNDVGLDYLTIDRTASTLAGGEAQRIRLASQIGSGLSGVLYVLDEPSIGLHQRDNKRLINTLLKLRDLDNSVIVIEHDRETMNTADWLIDFGPGAGENGGEIVAQGTPRQIINNKDSITGKYLSGKKEINVVKAPNKEIGDNLILIEATQHNLKAITVKFPLGKFICVTGVSGSGKSTLVHDILYHALAQKFHPLHKEKPGKFSALQGDENLDKVILIDQSPIGRTPRSNPATYAGAFTFIRDLFAMTKEARVRGYKPGRFSFNVKGGRCEACQGEGQTKIEMQFLPPVYVNCEVCHGKRYNSEALNVTYKGKNIAEVLDMTVEESLNFFTFPVLINKLQTLYDVGLGYVRLGQPAPTLSGGEAQRVKLATELSKRATGKTLYILDEPTTGLHFADLEKLLYVLKRLVVGGNTVIVIEHNLDVVKNADWIIDLGPEGGEAGGKVIANGTPEDVARSKESYTARFLREIFKNKAS